MTARFGDSRLPDRFWVKVTPEPNSGCWLWTSNIKRTGYGSFWWKGRDTSLHRLVYETLVEPLGDSYVDHRCNTPSCCNPDHLRPTTNRLNVLRGVGPTAVNARKTHCKRGHQLTEENTYRKPSGERVCRTCKVVSNRVHLKRWRERRAARRTQAVLP